jgi:type I restriction enzyme M protein
MNVQDLKQLEEDLWRSADTLRANSDLKATEYSTPVLGLIFLKFADNKYRQNEKAIMARYAKFKGSRREKPVSEIAIEKCGFYLPDHARYDHLLKLPEEQDIAMAIKKAMEAIKEYKPELQGDLPQGEYFRLTRTDRSIPKQLLKNFSNIPENAQGDMFGQIYEYFLGNFAMAEGQGGGEFFTPRSVVRLMVEIIEPHRGTVFDPACGSGGMFVQSAKFIKNHRHELANGNGDLFVYGQEKTLETVKLAKMNLAVNGLRGDIRQTNTYYEDPFESFGQFDYVLTNPPFNVDDVSLKRVETDNRFNTYGIPRKKTRAKKKDQGNETVPNANYLWINLFATSLKPEGRAALVMANSASDARHSEADIRKTLIEKNLIYGMLTLPSNMFYTVALPATLWFFDRAKPDDRILFIDARNIFTQIDRAHREFSDAQVQNIAMISALHRGKRESFIRLIDHYFEKGMETLVEGQQQVAPVSKQLKAVLDGNRGKAAAADLKKTWSALKKLQNRYGQYLEKSSTQTAIGRKNQAQHTLHRAFVPFFESLHQCMKQVDQKVRDHEQKMAKKAKAEGKRNTVARPVKALKAALQGMHSLVEASESYCKHILWLQERFPKAQYEDVTGLCKLATPQEVKEQDYSLNPGRYVGVVIEEDGKTEAEFVDELLAMNRELSSLNKEARKLEKTIHHNMLQIAGEK